VGNQFGAATEQGVDAFAGVGTDEKAIGSQVTGVSAWCRRPRRLC
jgi:hypothetical protein